MIVCEFFFALKLSAMQWTRSVPGQRTRSCRETVRRNVTYPMSYDGETGWSECYIGMHFFQLYLSKFI